jgi:hypothetical protein
LPLDKTVKDDIILIWKNNPRNSPLNNCIPFALFSHFTGIAPIVDAKIFLFSLIAPIAINQD